MSDLNINISSSGFSGLDQETIKAEPVGNINATEINPVNALVNKKLEDKVEKEVVPEKVDEVVEEMNKFFQSMQRQLSFSIDEQSGEKIIVVKDTDTDEVIRQIPSEELVVLRKKMDDVVGILFDTKV